MADIDTGDWLTDVEAGQRFGISRHAARALAKRRGWQRRTPNRPNEQARVLVPNDADVQPRAPVRAPIIADAQTPVRNGAIAGDQAEQNTFRVIELALAALTTQLARADEQIKHERERSTRLEVELADSRTALADAVAAERIAYGEAAALRSKIEERHTWKRGRRVWAAIRGD